VAIASHELRTPASSVYGVLATLAERSELDPETRETLIQVGYEQAERLRRLIEQLLDLSQLDARRTVKNPKPIELRTMLSELATEIVPRDMPVQLDMPPNLNVLADPVMIERVVSNLLVNAVRYGSPPISIAVDEPEGLVRIAVEDSGPGGPGGAGAAALRAFSRAVRTRPGAGSASRSRGRMRIRTDGRVDVPARRRGRPLRAHPREGCEPEARRRNRCVRRRGLGASGSTRRSRRSSK
jgi:K+-sensing histidine kinase KdpD